MATGNRGGRPPKPRQLHILNGNPSKIPNLEAKFDAEPKPPVTYTPQNYPPPPDYLPQDAKDCWNDNAPMLAAMKLLTIADLKALEVYCMNYACYRKVAKNLADANLLLVYKPHAATQPNSSYFEEVPQARSMRAFGKEMRDWAREFGMTPAARARMVPMGSGEDDTGDEMERLLRGG